MSKKTTVRLLSYTRLPIETIYCEWLQSRTSERVPAPEDVWRRIRQDRQKHGLPDEAWALYDRENGIGHMEGQKPGPFETEVMKVFQEVIAMKMPLGESISFVFLLENVPVALREQLVRHRIGHKFGDRLGADIIPDLAGGSSFWSQTTRIINMGKFATQGDYLTPSWLDDHGEERHQVFGVRIPMESCPICGSPDIKVDYHGAAYCSKGHLHETKYRTVQEYYDQCMVQIEQMYSNLVQSGMPLEDARNVLPVAMMHRMTWTTNLQALMHVLSRRGCWLAQLGMWEPVIQGIISELADRIDPSMRRLIDPPCFDQNGEFKSCAFGRENEEIVEKGEYPPCSLWINADRLANETTETKIVGLARRVRYDKMMDKYTKLWGRDPRTGERKVLA